MQLPWTCRQAFTSCRRLPLRSAGRHWLLAIPFAALQAHAAHDGDIAVGSSQVATAASRRDVDVPTDRQLEDLAAVVGDICVERLSVFDTRRDDEDNVVFRLANKLHIQTQPDVIRSQLLLKPGDLFQVRLLRESERLLRANGYLHDAQIRPVAYRDGKVDLCVYTQDVWTLKPGVSFGRAGGRNSTAVGIEEANLFGWGKSLALDIRSGVDRRSKVLQYGDRHVFSSPWALDAEYASNSDGRGHKLAIERPFRALDDRWTAGAAFTDERRIDSVYEAGQIANAYATWDRKATAYGGWSQGLRGGSALRWTTGVTLDQQRYGPAPGTVDTIPPDRKLLYPWVGLNWVEDQFAATQNHDQIGKTEDLSFGWNISGRLGIARQSVGSDRDALIFKAALSKGWEPAWGHVFALDGHAEGRVEGNNVRGALFDLTGRYHWRHSSHNTFFASATVDRGVGMDANQQILLGGDSGLRGYPLRYQNGAGRWLITLEERTFTDWYPLRLFRVGGALFYDMGRTWESRNTTVGSRGVLRDVGAGLRLGNSRSALSTVIHLDAAFPLDGDPSIKRVQFVVVAKKSF